MIVRRVLGSLAGIVTSTLVIMASEWIVHRTIGVADPATAAPSLFIMVIAGWGLGALVGGLVGGTIARWRGAAWIVGAIVAIGVIANAMAMPQPLWVSSTGVALAVLAARLAAGLARSDQRVAL